MTYKLEKKATLVDLIDSLRITSIVDAKTNKTTSVPVFCSTHEDYAAAALIFVNYKKGTFDSLTIIPYDTEAQMKKDYAVQLKLYSSTTGD